MRHYSNDRFVERLAGVGALLLLAGLGYGAVLLARAVLAWWAK